MTVSEDEFFRQRGFGQKIGFGERPALIIIDIVKAFTDATRMLGANLDSQIQAIRPLLEVAHERGFPVLFSTVRYEERELRDAGLWGIKMKGSATLKADGDGWEIDPRLDVQPSDSILFKKYASCFFGTDLVPRLTSRGVDTLIVTGCTTSGCVRATAVDAVQNGFRPWWCGKPSATGPCRRTNKACSISTPNMPTWSRSMRPCNICAMSATTPRPAAA